MPLVIRDKGLKKILKALKGVKVIAKAGIQGSDAVEAHDDGGPTNVELGVWHEFGVPETKLPSRSFMRSTMDEQENKYFRMVLHGTRQTTDSRGMVPPDIWMGQIAEAMASDIKKKIRSNVPPPLSEKYAQWREARGKGRRTLVLTGQLLGSITPKVDKR